MNPTPDILDERVLILASSGRDVAPAAAVLQRDGFSTLVCDDLIEMSNELPRGAGVLLLVEEALPPKELPVLVAGLTRQPPWSDVPVIVMTRGTSDQDGMRLMQAFSPMSNITLLERPLSALTLGTTLQAALRTRRRQYQVRDLLDEQKQTAEAIRFSRAEVLRLNVELEQRVAHRTAELCAANAELEAFCYSVSHDLRAPLRAIDGFALSIMEHCESQLDETGRGYLTRARAAVTRMQQLISDLLSLSRLSRAEMKMERVDLSQIVALIARELQNLHPTRTDVDFKIEPDVFVFGDAALLRIALENLLGNAWKFTGQRKGVVIEFGARRDQGTPVFFVRDNGAGFDMTYASKLFAPFQRLHTSHEFPGSGIGLATVQRIIRRHEGEVWAEGKRGEGATVYFRLQKERVASVSESPRPGETKASASIASKNSPAPLVPA